MRVALASRGMGYLLDRLRAGQVSDPPTPPSPIAPRRLAIPDHDPRNRLLVIDGSLPRPDRDSGSVRMLAILRLMREADLDVDFLPEDGREEGTDADALRALGVRVLGRSWSSMPASRLLRSAPHAGVLACRYHLARYWFPLLRQHASTTRRILDTVDLHFLREGREAELMNKAALARAARATRRQELKQIARADTTWVVSEVERDLLAELVPGATIEIVSNIHAPRATTPHFAQRHGVLFVGGGRHPPNADAVRWLVSGILPRLGEGKRQAIDVHLVGAGLQEALGGLNLPANVQVHGHVPDLSPLLERCRVGVAPLRFGAGVKGKINQYMSHGLPTVATSLAAEAMHLTDGQDVLLADDESGFAAAIERLHAEGDLWQRLSGHGLANIRRHFSEEAMLPAILRTFPPASTSIR